MSRHRLIDVGSDISESRSRVFRMVCESHGCIPELFLLSPGFLGATVQFSWRKSAFPVLKFYKFRFGLEMQIETISCWGAELQPQAFAYENWVLGAVLLSIILHSSAVEIPIILLSPVAIDACSGLWGPTRDRWTLGNGCSHLPTPE